MDKIKELMDKINLPSLVEAHKEISKFVTGLDIPQSQKDEINKNVEEIQAKLKELGNG
jgi:hypothetical protein